jgi:lactoylglutathione lyase
MRLRLELFVEELDAAIAFYSDLLSFTVARRTGTYAVLVRGQVVLGLGLTSQLSEYDGTGPGPAWLPFHGTKGAGVEIVLEVGDEAELSTLYEHCLARAATIEPLRLQPWGLHDFRLTDPDGYYVRVTHGDAV